MIRKDKSPMYDELTDVDIKKMQEEIEYRILVVRPQCLEDVKTARAFGDLSENFEYKEAKRQKNRNESRIRYLQRMIRTAKVVDATHEEGCVGLFDKVTLYLPEDEETMEVKLVTTLRVNADSGLISRESPLGRAIFGHSVGETVQVEVRPGVSYPVEIRSIQPSDDDASLPISQY